MKTPLQTSTTRLPRSAFTLIELLVSIAIIALLTGILLPSLASARATARQSVCTSNLRQLGLSVHTYANDYKGVAAPGASNFLANKNRWHGARASIGQPFVAAGGSLSAYFGESDAGSNSGNTGDANTATAVRSCPEFVGIMAQLAGIGQGFERRCGGYGYNNAYIGVQRAANGQVRSDRAGASLWLFNATDKTIVFADTAFAAGDVPGDVIEYSFAEPRFYGAAESDPADPSIHFRHGGRSASGAAGGNAAAAWLDGHVSAEVRTYTWSSGLYPADPAPLRIGWFGAAHSNILFSGR